MLTRPTAYQLLTLVSLTYGSPTKDYSNIGKRAVVPYMPTDYKYPSGSFKDSRTGVEVRPTIMIPRYNEDKWLNFCARYDVTHDGLTMPEGHTCYQDTNALSENATTKPTGVKVWPGSSAPGCGPCVQLLSENRAFANQRAGWWPGRNINCVLFWTNNCVYDYKNESSGAYYAESPATVLPPPGLAVMETGPWQDVTLNTAWFKDPFGKDSKKTAAGP
ncbi:uncharacterized protein AB675_7741 [Cyphellophora attinorum]|uniref:Uncharacterized protein n=1 Tax=Cyphellophora attinorum TaxID=1664694 RepID=A0A0N1H4S3_9EURO|nr:uncharacterized protein AB675_7741 [Phialophora attinorum]KPI40435.1 hypothetical protein AB675_7741 [Phialophora attinorum]